MTAVRVRRARRADVPAVVEMARALADGLGNEKPAITADKLTRNAFGRERWCSCLVATLGGAPVGYAIYCPTFEGHIGNRQIYLSDLFVRPEARSSGAGRALMKAVARVAVETDCVAVTWELWDQNVLGRAFYEKLGCWVAEEVNPMRLDSSALKALAKR
jgi:GNAT superfamily N-acetyltransferase